MTTPGVVLAKYVVDLANPLLHEVVNGRSPAKTAP